MKTPTVLALTIAVSWTTETARAARESGPSSGGIFVNPVGAFYGPLPVEFAFGAGSRTSINVTGSRWSHFESSAAGTIGGWGVGGGVQMFPVGPLYEGVFAYPSVSYLWISTDRVNDQTQDTPPRVEDGFEQNAIVPQVLFGYQFDWKVVSLRLGLGGFYVIPLRTTGEVDLGLEGLCLALDISLGVTF